MEQQQQQPSKGLAEQLLDELKASAYGSLSFSVIRNQVKCAAARQLRCEGKITVEMSGAICTIHLIKDGNQ